MSKHLIVMVVLTLLLAPLAGAQVPGAYPHLQLTNGLGPLVPPVTGPFDNSNVFPAFSGQSFQARMSYASAGQPNQNVLWAIIISATKTPFPTTGTPPQLLTMPPVILLMPNPVNLSATGQGLLNLFVPAGILDAQTYIQGLIYDSTSSPPMRLSNGLLVDVNVPGFSVDFAWFRASPASEDETLLRDSGEISIGPEQMPKLKPIGAEPPPMAVAGPAFFADDVRFLSIAPNEADEPVNPRARPFTKISAAAGGTDATLIVQDTSFFPTRGRLLVAGGNENPWGAKLGTGNVSPRVEVVFYDGKLKDRFLNCKRSQIGSSIGGTVSSNYPHVVGEMVIGDYTLATTSGAQARTRVGLDADNVDMPHVVIPAFSAPTGPEGELVTQDVDLYLFESKVNQAQGFVVFDRISHTWRMVEGSLKNTVQGRWNPVVCVAPDGRSFIAELVVNGGILGWDNAANVLCALRTDGLDWPASGTETWQIPYQVEPDPATTNVTNVRSRKVSMAATAIIGPNSDNYVAYVGLVHKWKPTPTTPGTAFEANKGYEGDWVREEVLVRDYIEVPLVAPGSNKALPSVPRPYIFGDFGINGFSNQIVRFDPDVLVRADKQALVVAGGGGPSADEQEDVFIIRNVAITGAGTVTKTLNNLSGFSNSALNAGATHVRSFSPGGHGQGRKAAFSPGNTRVAWTAKKNASVKADWLQWANTNGSSYGKIKNVFDDGTKNFKMDGAYKTDRMITGLRWVDENRILFMMGKNPWDDVAAVNLGNAPQFDLFVYDVTKDTMVNLTKTGGGNSDFANLGKIAPAAFFASPNGDFAYFLRGSAPVAAGTPVTMNLVGVNLQTLQAFGITGPEFGGSALVGNMELPMIELQSQVESPCTMHFVEGSGVQPGMMYYTAHEAAGNASDEVIGVNLDTPFVAFQVTNTPKASLAVADLTPNPFGATVAFARTDAADAMGATQHPFVVDLDNFMFERDLLPMWVSGGANLGRVMGGSFHFIPPNSTAGDALVFSYGFNTLPNGIALMATPAYYPLAAVSDLLAQPVPIVIPLVDTLLLGVDYRFYVPDARLAADD